MDNHLNYNTNEQETYKIKAVAGFIHPQHPQIFHTSIHSKTNPINYSKII